MKKYLLGTVVVFVGACCKEPERSASRPPPPLAASRFPEVVLLTPAVAPDGAVTLSWQVHDVPASIVKPEGCFIRIERRPAGGAWVVLTEIPISKGGKYRDTDTQPKTTYEYRGTLGILDPAWTPAKPGRLTDKIGGPVAVRTPGIWSIQFSNIQSFEDAVVQMPGQAYVIIRKYDKDHGLVEWRKIQHEGEDLGVITEGGVEVSRHRVVTAAGRAAAVDFRTGGKIKKITTEKMVLYTYEECPRRFGRAGAGDCDGPQKKAASYRVKEVLYTDDEGNDQIFTSPDGPGPIADKLCQDHGGPPPPRELSPAERLAWREEQADQLMDQADALWESEKPADRKQAQEIYKKLLASFIDLESPKARKGEFAERSRKKID